MIIAIKRILVMVDLEYPSVFGSGNAISGFMMTGCVRYSSSNHRGEVCPRFDYWTGSRCKHCFYLHDHNLCPLFTKDKVDKKTFVKKRERLYIAPKDNDNSYRNAYQIEVQHASEEQL